MTKSEAILCLTNLGGFDTSYQWQGMKSCIEQVFESFEKELKQAKDIGKGEDNEKKSKTMEQQS